MQSACGSAPAVGSPHRSAQPFANRVRGRPLNARVCWWRPVSSTPAVGTNSGLPRAPSTASRGAPVAASPAATEPASSATSSNVYRDITVYVPFGENGYYGLKYKMITQNQLTKKPELARHDYFIEVKDKPVQHLLLGDFPDGIVHGKGDVELSDGIQLAVVLDKVPTPTAQLEQRLTSSEEQVASLSGAEQRRTKAQELMCSEWAVSYLQQLGDRDAKRWCYKILKGKVKGVFKMIETDGVAYSSRHVALVERKTHINYEYVEEVAGKADVLRELVGAGVTNTNELRDSGSRRIKPLEVFLMADGWTDNADEVAACQLQMAELNIKPVLPRGGSYDVGDGCHPWPPLEDGLRLRAQAYHRAKGLREQQQ